MTTYARLLAKHRRRLAEVEAAARSRPDLAAALADLPALLGGDPRTAWKVAACLPPLGPAHLDHWVGWSVGGSGSTPSGCASWRNGWCEMAALLSRGLPIRGPPGPAVAVGPG